MSAPGGPPGAADRAIVPDSDTITVSNARAVATLDLDGGLVAIEGGGTLVNAGTIFGFGGLASSGSLDNSSGTIEANGELLSFAGFLIGARWR